MHGSVRVLIAFAIVMIGAVANCEVEATKNKEPPPKEDADFFPEIKGIEAEKAKDASSEFRGAGFGSGLAIVTDVGGGDRVSDADVVNGIVRVKRQNDLQARVVLNLHYFFDIACKSGKESRWCRSITLDDNSKVPLVPMWGLGPFVAVQPGSDEFVKAVGFGLLFGFRRQPDKADSFNIGLGFLVDQNVKTLGDGIKENAPLPTGETEIRYKEESRWGAMLMASWAF